MCAIKTTCSKCGYELEVNRIGKYRYCLACHAEHMRLHRPKHSNLPDEQRNKANARAHLRLAVKRGQIEKQPCVICGSMENLEGHHEDYSKPLEVIWYCREHHVTHVTYPHLDNNSEV